MFSTKVRVLVQQQWAGLIALFLVLTGGVAWASHPGGAGTINSADIINGEVKEADVGQGAVASAEVKNDSIVGGDVAPNSLPSGTIRDGSLTGVDVANNSLKGADIDEDTLSKTILQRRVGASCPSGQAIRVVGENGGVTCQALTGSSPLGPAGGHLTGDYPNPAIRSNAVNSAKVADDSLTGADVAESTLGQVPSALLGGFGRSGPVDFLCDPVGGTFVTCAATEVLDVPPGAAALVIGRARANAGAASAVGDCRLGTSSIGEVPNSLQTFFLDANDNDNATLVGVTPPLPAGATSFGIDCAEFGGDIVFRNVSASVVLISDD